MLWALPLPATLTYEIMDLDIIQSKIYELRGQRVMLDFDLASIYQVETRTLKQAVRRNIERFEGEDFMFELICDDTISSLCKKIAAKGIKYGFGGIARVGYGMLPAELIIAEHYHLGSTAAILSRGFCDANLVSDPTEIESIFIDGVKNIRLKEAEVSEFTEEQYRQNLSLIRTKVAEIVEKRKSK